MNSDLEQLKQLVFDGGWDNESRIEVMNFEQQLHDASVREQLANHPAIKPFVDYLKSRKEAAELLLKTDRTLNDRGRDALFERIDVCDNFLQIFGGEQRRSIEQSIREALARTTPAPNVDRN